MPAQITERPKRRQSHESTDDSTSAQILQFPSGDAAEEDIDNATALARIVQSLTKHQSVALGREIGVLSATIANKLAAAPIDIPEGVRPRHSERCASKRTGGTCDCDPPWEASVWSTFDKRKIRKTLPTRQAAIKWRRKHYGLAESGQLRAPTRMTLAETAYTWLEMASSGEIRNRSGRTYKPSALRTIEGDFRLRLIPELGMHFMSDIERSDLQARVNAWQARHSASKVHACVNAARVLWRDFDLVTGANNLLVIDPTKGLRLPAVPITRERIATTHEAHRLIAALEQEDQALWGTAMYAGIRLGELRALRVEKIDLALKRIKVHAGWDQYEGEIDTKTEKGKRTTVVIDLLEDLLVRHLKRTGRSGRDLVFGKTASDPFCPGTIHNKAKRAWKEARQLEDEANIIPEGERVRPIGLHDSRHTAVSHMLDAGITIDKVSKFMGHASITVTIDRYGHLLPGGEAEAAEILNEYHARRQRR
jgi:integrase